MTVIHFPAAVRPAFPVSEGRAVEAIVASLKRLGEPATADEICELITSSDLPWGPEIALCARDLLTRLSPEQPGYSASAGALRAVRFAGRTGYALTPALRDYLRRHGHVFTPRVTAP